MWDLQSLRRINSTMSPIRLVAGAPISAAALVVAIREHSAQTGTRIDVVFEMVGAGQLTPTQVKGGEILLVRP